MLSPYWLIHHNDNYINRTDTVFIKLLLFSSSDQEAGAGWGLGLHDCGRHSLLPLWRIRDLGILLQNEISSNLCDPNKEGVFGNKVWR